jgi:hypothetical protein
MTTQTITTYDEPCPGCDQSDGAYWVTSTPDTDAWACRHCGTTATAGSGPRSTPRVPAPGA